MDDKKFALTRMVTEKHIDFVLIKCDGYKVKKQCIQLFHNQLQWLHFIRIDDMLISERTHPTSSDLNKIFIDALDLKVSFDDIKQSDSMEEITKLAYECWWPLLHIQKRRMDEAKSLLIRSRTVNLVIVLKELESMNAKLPHGSQAARDKQREIKLYLQADQCEAVQRHHFENHKDTLRMVSEAAQLLNPTDLSELTELYKRFNDSIDDFGAIWQKYDADTNNARAIKWEAERHGQMTNMKVFLAHHFNLRVSIAEFINDCEKHIKSAKHRHQTLMVGDGYTRNSRLTDELVRDKEDRRREVNNEMQNFKVLVQKSMDNKIAL